ncbi:MAG: hypothetical protein VYE15_04705, partial [Myxococcota bacterium]|nr:hypothetical protein [Myxococcota bacterium]
MKRGDLLDVMEGGASAPETWRVGTEYETFAYSGDGGLRLPYEAAGDGPDIRSLLTLIHDEEAGWALDHDDGFVV